MCFEGKNVIGAAEEGIVKITNFKSPCGANRQNNDCQIAVGHKSLK